MVTIGKGLEFLVWFWLECIILHCFLADIKKELCSMKMHCCCVLIIYSHLLNYIYVLSEL